MKLDATADRDMVKDSMNNFAVASTDIVGDRMDEDV